MTVVEIQAPVDALVEVIEPPGVQGPPGPPGPIGPPGQWTQMTQAEYDALSPADPDTLYVIIG